MWAHECCMDASAGHPPFASYLYKGQLQEWPCGSLRVVWVHGRALSSHSFCLGSFYTTNNLLFYSLIYLFSNFCFIFAFILITLHGLATYVEFLCFYYYYFPLFFLSTFDLELIHKLHPNINGPGMFEAFAYVIIHIKQFCGKNISQNKIKY